MEEDCTIILREDHQAISSPSEQSKYVPGNPLVFTVKDAQIYPNTLNMTYRLTDISGRYLE
jgi:hypothetical protein